MNNKHEIHENPMTSPSSPIDSKHFKPGIYEHYKRAGNYVALQLVSHHDTDELFVVYVCGSTGRTRIREWSTPGKDSWSDLVEVPSKDGGMERAPRFRYIGPSV